MRVLVTGGSRGIGAAIVQAMSETSDTQIAFTYNTNKSLAEEVIHASEGAQIECTTMDLKDPSSIESAMTHLMKLWGGFDVVIHNAAICSDTPFMAMKPHQWQEVLNVSLNSFYYINQQVLPGMMLKKFGRIIPIVSVSGEMGNRGQVNYSAAKGALISATKALSKEVARKGILVNAVSPGLIETDMTADLTHLNIKQMIPVGRIGKPREVADVVRFLCSEQASYISGSVIQVNGGLYT